MDMLIISLLLQGYAYCYDKYEHKDLLVNNSKRMDVNEQSLCTRI